MQIRANGGGVGVAMQTRGERGRAKWGWWAGLCKPGVDRAGLNMTSGWGYANMVWKGRGQGKVGIKD